MLAWDCADQGGERLTPDLQLDLVAAGDDPTLPGPSSRTVPSCSACSINEAAA